jgi:hypothetical protein
MVRNECFFEKVWRAGTDHCFLLYYDTSNSKLNIVTGDHAEALGLEHRGYFSSQILSRVPSLRNGQMNNKLPTLGL